MGVTTYIPYDTFYTRSCFKIEELCTLVIGYFIQKDQGLGRMV